MPKTLTFFEKKYNKRILPPDVNTPIASVPMSAPVSVLVIHHTKNIGKFFQVNKLYFFLRVPKDNNTGDDLMGSIRAEIKDILPGIKT